MDETDCAAQLRAAHAECERLARDLEGMSHCHEVEQDMRQAAEARATHLEERVLLLRIAIDDVLGDTGHSDDSRVAKLRGCIAAREQAEQRVQDKSAALTTLYREKADLETALRRALDDKVIVEGQRAQAEQALADWTKRHCEPRITTRCPSCGHDTLFIAKGGHLTCSWLECKSPGLGRYMDQAKKAEAARQTSEQSMHGTAGQLGQALVRLQAIWRAVFDGYDMQSDLNSWDELLPAVEKLRDAAQGACGCQYTSADGDVRVSHECESHKHLRERNNALVERNRKLHLDNEALADKCRASEARADKSEQALADCQRERDQLRTWLAEWQGHTNDARDQLATLRAEHAKVREALAAACHAAALYGGDHVEREVEAAVEKALAHGDGR